MDYKQFRRRLADRLHRQNADIDALTEGLSMVVSKACSDLDSVAVPAFGTFVATKHDEEISVDLSTGERMLMPPEITVDFVTGGMLAKKMRNE